MSRFLMVYVKNILNIKIKKLTYERHRISRWQRYTSVPHHQGHQQAADSHFRQTDDLLPHLGADAGRHP